MTDFAPDAFFAIHNRPSVLTLLADTLPPGLFTTGALLGVNGGSALPMGQRMHWVAVENWLHACDRTLAVAQDWSDVQGVVEACHHCHQLGRWYLAYQLACWPVGDAPLPLHEQLAQWGYYRALAELFQPLLGQLNPAVDLHCLDCLGRAYHGLGELSVARYYHQQQLQLAQGRGALAGEMAAHWGLGMLARSQDQKLVAYEHFQRHYALACQLGDRRQQAKALCQLGDIFTPYEDSPQRIVKLQEALTLAQALGDRELQQEVQFVLGINYFWRKQYPEARVCLEVLRSEAYCCQNSPLELRALVHLSMTYYFLDMREEALVGFHEALGRVRQPHSLGSELFVLHNTSVFLSSYQLDLPVAIAYSQRTLAIAAKLNNINCLVRIQAQLASLYALEGELTHATKAIQQVMDLYHQYRDRTSAEDKSIVMAYLAQARWVMGQRLQAIGHLLHAFALFPPWQNPNGQLILGQAIVTLVPPCLRSRWHPSTLK